MSETESPPSQPPKKRRSRKSVVTRFRYNFTLPDETIETLKNMVKEGDVESMSEGVEFCVKYFKIATQKIKGIQ